MTALSEARILPDSTIRVISERQGLVWTGTDAVRAEEVALVTAVNTARTVYVHTGDEND